MLVSSAGRKFKLATLFRREQVVSLGRHSGASINIIEITGNEETPGALLLLLSRTHAILTVKDGHLLIQDKNTLNGTYVNNQKILPNEWKTINNDDVITLGGPNPMQHYEETIANPFTLTAKRLQDFLANYVPVPAADPPAGPSVQHPRPPARERDGQEVYSFGSTRNQDTQERDTAPIAAVDPRTRSRLRPLQSPSRPTVNVIDLTVDDSPPPAAAPPRSSRRRQSEGQVEVLSAKEAKRTRPTECQASGSARINGGAGSSGMALPPPSAPPAPTEAGPSAAGPSVVDNIKQQFTCPICQDLVVAAHAMVPCGHCFCGACLSAWLGQGKRDCPNCRKETTAPPVRQNAIDNAVEAIAGQLTAEEKEAMKEKKEEWETGKGRFERLLQAAADRPAFLPGVANRFALAMGGVLSGPLAASWAMPSRSYALGPASLPASARPVGQTGSRHDIQWQAHVGYVRNSPGREVVVCCGCHQAMNAGQGQEKRDSWARGPQAAGLAHGSKLVSLTTASDLELLRCCNRKIL